MTLNLSKLRPADDSSASVQSSIDAVSTERVATEGRLADAKARRGELLLNGTTADLKAGEDAIRTVELELLQLSAMADALPARLEEALNRERAEAQALLIEDAKRAVVAWNAFFTGGEYDRLAKAVAAGIELETAALAAMSRIDRNVFHAAIASEDFPRMKAMQMYGEWSSAKKAIVLPGIDGAPAYAVPPREAHSIYKS